MCDQSKARYPETRHSLLARLKASDSQHAWEEFVSIYRPVIYRTARSRGLQEADAQDLTQTVLLSISKAIQFWEPRDEEVKFRHWIRKVVKNAIIKDLTRRPRDQAQGGSTVQGISELQAEDLEQIEATIATEHQREVYLRAAACVRAEIAAETWRVFQLAVVEGIPIETVAETVGKSIGAAYAARGRVMKRLKQTIKRIEGGMEWQ